MAFCELDRSILETFSNYARDITVSLKSDVFLYTGPIGSQALPRFRNLIEQLKEKGNSDTLSFILTTGGGEAEAAAKMVEVLRYHYKFVNFYIPDSAMSAGTILALSGDKICMDYYSSLGPVDPQVMKRKDGVLAYVPVLGYLEQAELLIEKSRRGELTPAEFALLKDMDLGMLKRYEQAKNLSIQLIKEWLVKYKFKDWKEHATTPEKKGKKVTDEEKVERANQIAEALSDYKLWLSHSRKISMQTLQDVMKLKIDNMNGSEVQTLIRRYNDSISTFKDRNGATLFMHTQFGWEAV